MSTTPKKLRLYDRLINKLIPLHQAEIDLLNQEQATLVEQERLYRAEADRVTLENKAKAASVALQEEDNAREREQLNRAVIVARAEYEISSKINNTWTDVIVVLTLSESQISRDIEIIVLNKATQCPISGHSSVDSFITAQPSFTLWFQPWLEGTLELKALKNIEADDCFKRIFLVKK